MEEALVARLLATASVTSLCGSRINWNARPQGQQTSPDIVLTRVSGVRDYSTSGPIGYVQSRVQIDCYAVTYTACVSLSRAVRVALSGWKNPALPAQILGSFLDLERQSFEDGTPPLHRVSFDFIIHHSE
jgi:hypothetical protein